MRELRTVPKKCCNAVDARACELLRFGAQRALRALQDGCGIRLEAARVLEHAPNISQIIECVKQDGCQRPGSRVNAGCDRHGAAYFRPPPKYRNAVRAHITSVLPLCQSLHFQEYL